MSRFGSYGSRGRAEQRKKKKNNLLVNGAIALVIIGIVFVSGMLIFGGDDSETATKNNENENNAVNDVNEENEANEANENNEQEDKDDSMNEVNNENNDEEINSDNNDPNLNDQGSNNDGNNGNEEEIDRLPPVSGEWKPVGTEQAEPFVAVYEKEHINWQEMTRALQHATGLGDDMTIWWLGNGGDHQSAEAVVGKYELRDTPYKVRIEWVTNEGWMPVSVEQLSENPYRSSPTNTNTDGDTDTENNTDE